MPQHTQPSAPTSNELYARAQPLSTKQQQRSESDDEADAESGPEGDEEGTEEEEEDTDEPKVVKVVSPKPKQAKKPRKKKLMRTRPVPRIRRVKS